MKILHISVVVCLFKVIAARTNHLIRDWDNDIYVGRQWNEYLTPTKVASPVVKTPGILLLYSPECPHDLDEIPDWVRPPLQYLCYAKHDCETTQKYIWYHLDDKDRLCERYNYKELKCGSYLFFANGSDINQPTEIFDPDNYDGDVLEWMWDKSSVEFSVQNTLKEPVVVQLMGRGRKVPSQVVEPQETLTFKGYLSYVILVLGQENGTFYYGRLINEVSEHFTIKITAEKFEDGQIAPRKWYKRQDAKVQEKSRYLLNWRWGIASIYLMDFKQTPILPKFTDLGYKKGTMPIGMYKKIMQWYKENDGKREPEGSTVEPAINDSEVKCSLVFFDAEMTKYIGEIMKPYLEEWSNLTLVQTRLYGIREYYHGNILRNHVDRITTHIVSVILQIDKELDGAPDWELEVIGFDGYRKNVTLEPGEMLFYESATLIHGRPYPFQGKWFANAFLHYKPADDWPWSISSDGAYLLKNGKHFESTRILSTPNTYKFRKHHDEL